MGSDASAHLLQIIASVTSLLACIWLPLCGFRNLRRTLRRQLFFRQILGLAIADALFGIGSLTITILSLALPDGRLLCENLFPGIYIFVQGFGEYVSLLIGTQIGVAFAATSVRSNRAMQVLELTRNLVWPLGLIFALVDQAINPTDFNGVTCQTRGSNYVFVTVGCICISVTLCCYAGVCWYMAVREQPDGVVRRIWRRTSLYLIAMVVTVGPYLISNAVGQRQMDHEKPHIFTSDHVCMALYCLNGAANVLIYAAQSRHFKQPLSTSHRRAAEELLKEVETAALADGASRLAVEYSVYFREQMSVVLFEASSHSTSRTIRDEMASAHSAAQMEDAEQENHEDAEQENHEP